MADPTVTSAVSKNWENRETLEEIQLTMLQITQFLNRFDSAARFRLAKLDEKIVKLERGLAHVEFALDQNLASSSVDA